jgi:hypothetical protein
MKISLQKQIQKPTKRFGSKSRHVSKIHFIVCEGLALDRFEAIFIKNIKQIDLIFLTFTWTDLGKLKMYSKQKQSEI